MEYSIRDLLQLLIKKWYTILLTSLVVCCVSWMLSQTSYAYVAEQHDVLTAETFPEDTEIGKFQTTVVFAMTEPVDILSILRHDDAMCEASVAQLTYTKVDEKTIHVVLDYLNQSEAQKRLDKYLEVVDACAVELYEGNVNLQIAKTEFTSHAQELTPRAMLAQTVITQPNGAPSVTVTVIKAAVYGAVLACFGIIIATFVKDLSKAEKGMDNEK